MEITDLNLIGDFEAGIKCLQNPSLFSSYSLISSIDKVPLLYSFWKWGALILAFFAAFRSVIVRIKLFVHRIRAKSLVSCGNSCSQQIYDDDDFDFDFSDDDDTPSTAPVSDAEESDLEDYRKPAYEVFRAEGSGCYWGNNRGQDGNCTLRRRKGFSLLEFSAGKGVVRLWDSSDFEDDDDSAYGSDIRIWDLDRYVKISSGRWCHSPAAEEMNGDDDFDLPAVYAAWRPRQGMVDVKDNGGGVENATGLGWKVDGVIGQKEE